MIEAIQKLWPLRRAQSTEALGGKSVNAAAGGSVGLSALASFVGLCCIGPWSVALFGVTGAVALARWQPYRPLFLGLAAVMLAWAFWRTYRKPAVCDDESCNRRSSKWLKAALWLALLLLILAIFAEDLQWLIVDPTPPALRES